MFGSQSLFSSGFAAILLWGALLFCGMGTSNNAESRELPQLQSQPVVFATASPDTTHPIPAKPCNVVDTSYRRGLREDLEITEGYRSMGEYVAPSLHNLTCRWAKEYGYSTNPSRLLGYVQPTGDSLRLSENALLYIVRLDSMASKEEGIPYLVAEIGDSLAYTHTAAGKYLRDVREVKVPGTDTRYIWLESVREDVDSLRKEVTWWGRIFTYDRERGIQYAARAPVRFEMFEDGESIGYVQVDVSIPEPGIMKIEARDIPDSETLPTRLNRRSNLHKWIGLHVIDTTETDKRNLHHVPGNY